MTGHQFGTISSSTPFAVKKTSSVDPDLFMFALEVTHNVSVHNSFWGRHWQSDKTYFPFDSEVNRRIDQSVPFERFGFKDPEQLRCNGTKEPMYKSYWISPGEPQRGDILAIVNGGPTPFILRSINKGTWRYVGFATVKWVLAQRAPYIGVDVSAIRWIESALHEYDLDHNHQRETFRVY